MSVSPSLDIYSVSTTMINLNKLSILIRIEDTEEGSVETLGLIDSGAGRVGHGYGPILFKF